MKHFNLKKTKKIFAAVAALALVVALPCAASAEVYSNMSGDVGKVSQIVSQKTSYTLGVGESIDFDNEIAVYQSASVLITDHSYVEYDLYGNSSDFDLDGSVLTALRPNKEAKLTIYDAFGEKVKTEVTVKSVTSDVVSSATGFTVGRKTPVIYSSADGQNENGFTLEVNAYPMGAQFADEDKTAIGQDLAEKLKSVLGLDNMGFAENIGSSFTVVFAGGSVSLADGAAASFQIGNIVVTGASNNTGDAITNLEEIAALFDNATVKIGAVTWIGTVEGSKITFMPKPIADNYDDLSSTEKVNNNSAANILSLTVPATENGSVEGLDVNDSMTYTVGEINLIRDVADDAVTYGWKNEGTDGEDKSVIEIRVEDPTYFTETAKMNSDFAFTDTVTLSGSPMETRYGRKEYTARTTLVYTPAVEAKAFSLDSSVSLKVGEKAILTPNYYPSNANVFGEISYSASGDDYAAIEQDGNKLIVYGINSTSKAKTTVEAVMVTESYGTSRQMITINVKDAELKKAASRYALNLATSDLSVGGSVALKVIDAETKEDLNEKVIWKVKDAGIVSFKETNDAVVTITGTKAGTTTVTAVVNEDVKLVCSITVKDKAADVQTNPKPTGNPQTGDSWLANLLF